MLIQSTEYPSKFFKHQGRIFINDLSTIAEEKNEDATTYLYEHYHLEISDRLDLAHYIESNYTLLIKSAKEQFELNRINTALTPSQEDVDKANRDIETINLLVDLGVI